MARRKILITVEAEEMFDAETGKGFMHLTIEDCCVHVSEHISEEALLEIRRVLQFHPGLEIIRGG